MSAADKAAIRAALDLAAAVLEISNGLARAAVALVDLAVVLRSVPDRIYRAREVRQ